MNRVLKSVVAVVLLSGCPTQKPPPAPRSDTDPPVDTDTDTDPITDTDTDPPQDTDTDVGHDTDPVCPTDDSFEPNDDFHHTPQTLDGEAHLWLTEDSPVDFFRVPLSQAQEVEVSVSFLQSSGNIDLEVFDPNHVSLGTAHSLTDNENLVFTAHALGGGHYIRLELIGSGCVQYDLSIGPPSQ